MNRSVVPPPETLKVFISYSHDDDDLRKELVKHLSQLRREGLIEAWHDRQISGGSEWADQIDENLEAADIILLLVSSSFLHSDYCNDKEMARGLERHEAGQARVIPVILRPCDWQTAKFGKLQAFPTDGKPIVEWQPIDKGFLEVAQGLRKVISQLRPTAAPSQAATTKPVSFVTALPQTRRPWWVAALGVLVAIVALGGYWWFDAKWDFEASKEALQGQLLEPEKFDAEGFGKELDQLLAKAPKDPVLIMWDGDRYYRRNQLEQAKDRYEESIKLDPRLAEAHFRLGLFSDQENNLPEAQAHYKRAVELAPDTPRYQNNYAHTFLESGRYAEAIDEYGKIDRYILAAVEIAKARWAMGELAGAASEQARALDWLAKPDIADLSRNKETWTFFTDTAGFRMVTPDEKRCYAGLSLAATRFLQGKDEKAKETAEAAKCSDSSDYVKEVLGADLIRFVETVQPSLAERSSAFRNRYLNDAGQKGGGPMVTAGGQTLR